MKNTQASFAQLRASARFGVMYRPQLLELVTKRIKTETRRVVPQQPPDFGPECVRVAVAQIARQPGETDRWQYVGFDANHEARWSSAPFRLRFREGDYLYIKEPWSLSSTDGLYLWRPSDEMGQLLTADNIGQEQLSKFAGSEDMRDGKRRFRSKMFSPRWAARHLLRLDEVSIQRLQDIDNKGALNEGAGGKYMSKSPRDEFGILWDTINKPPADWTSNPFVAALKFELLSEGG
jgi:hypothetical protein